MFTPPCFSSKSSLTRTPLEAKEKQNKPFEERMERSKIAAELQSPEGFAAAVQIDEGHPQKSDLEFLDRAALIGGLAM